MPRAAEMRSPLPAPPPGQASQMHRLVSGSRNALAAGGTAAWAGFTNAPARFWILKCGCCCRHCSRGRLHKCTGWHCCRVASGRPAGTPPACTPSALHPVHLLRCRTAATRCVRLTAAPQARATPPCAVENGRRLFWRLFRRVGIATAPPAASRPLGLPWRRLCACGCCRQVSDQADEGSQACERVG